MGERDARGGAGRGSALQNDDDGREAASDLIALICYIDCARVESLAWPKAAQSRLKPERTR